MMRPILTTKAVILVVLAALQTLVFSMLPMVDYWRGDIETILSKRLGADVTVSQVGAKASLTGPYLEALNLIVERPDGRLEVQRIQLLLDLYRSVSEGRIVVSDMVLDEAELILHGPGGGVPDPRQWGRALDALVRVLEPLGVARVNDLDVIAGGLSLQRLFFTVTPEEGVLGRGRLVTETVSMPMTMDWRFPTDAAGIHDLRIHSRMRNAPIPVTGLDEITAAVDGTAWFEIQDDSPVRGILNVRGLADDDAGLTGEFTGQFALTGGSDAQMRLDAANLSVPGLTLRGSAGAVAYESGQIKAQLPKLSLDGPALDAFLARFDPSPKLRRLLANNAPDIELSNVRVIASEATPVQVQATVDQFSVDAFGGIPAIGPLSGELYLRGTQGWFEFETPSGTFSLPEIFPSPWVDHALSGLMAFDRRPDGLYLRGQSLRVAGPHQDVRGALLLDLPRDTEQSLQLELMVDASHQALPGLLPFDLDAEVQRFLTRAIEAVRVVNGRISYSGPMGKNIDRSRRELAMRFPMADYRFRPLTEWPAFVGQTGTVQFSDQRTRLSLTEADLGGLRVPQVLARQDADDAREIDVVGQIEGSARRALEVLDAAGVKPEALGRDVEFSGVLTGDVALEIPIDGRPRGTVDIEARALTVDVLGLAEPVTDLAGRGRYTLDQGFEASALRGSILGDRIEVDVKADNAGVEVRGSGKLQTQHVTRLAGLQFSDALLSGASAWTVIAQNQDDVLVVELETDGVGLISDLPEPLTKAAERAKPIRVRLIDDAISRRFEADVFANTEVTGRLDETPLALDVKTPELDVLGWASLPGDSETASNVSLLIDVDQLNAGETSLQVDTLAVTLRTGSVEAYVEGRDVEGRVIRFGQAPVRIELAYLMLPEAGEFLEPPGDDPLLDYNPGLIPSAEVEIATLARGPKEYRDLEATLISGEQRLDITRLAFERDGQRFLGELAWVLEDSGPESALILRAQGGDLGNFLRVNEDEPLLEASDGSFSTELTWAGSPLGFSILTSNGTVELSLADGRFVDLGNSAEVLRLFGILNIETLTRRLRLDFLDLVQPGVAFDQVQAAARLKDGVLQFDPALEMRGPSSSFQLTGMANLNEKTLSQRLSVDIPLTNNLPLASVLLGAPQVGGAIYLVEKALGTKIIKVGKTEYRIEGAFDDPQVRLIPPFTDRQKDQPNADTNSDRQ